MNLTPIEIAALVFTVLMLIGFLGFYNGWFVTFINLVQDVILRSWGG